MISRWPLMVSTASVVLYCAAVGLAGQPASDLPTFEVATIKPSSGNAPLAVERRADRLLVTNATLAWLIKWAYDLDDDRLLAIPPAAERARFDIVAKAPESPVRGRIQLMTQTLLRDRFRLQVHHEARRLDSYALVKAGALKVRIVSDDGKPAPSNPFSMSSAGRLRGTHVTAAMLAKVLTDQLRRPVQDESRVDGFFDFTLEWTPDSAADAGDPARPALFTAIREQLGFALEPRRTLVDVTVIDHVDVTPTPN
jgi:uncharacterized protein (TIGR03435 family)